MAALTSLVSMQTCLVPLPCFKWRPICPSLPKYSLQTCSRKVSLRKWSCMVECKFSGEGALSSDGNEGAIGSGSGNDEGSLRDREQLLKQSGRTFVVVIAHALVVNPHMKKLLKDISFLHSLGLKFVLIPGTDHLINMYLHQSGFMPKYDTPSIIIDKPTCVKLALGEVAKASIDIQSILSSNDTRVPVDTGNYIVAEKITTPHGVTGEVKNVDAYRIANDLDADHMVLLSQMCFSASGEILYCDLYELATSCALDLKAEKLVYVLTANRGGGRNLLGHALITTTLGGVPVHTVDGSVDGALSKFFRDGLDS